MDNYSSAKVSEHGELPGICQVRSFRATDRPQILRLHEALAPDASVDCQCAVKIEQIEEKYFRRPQDHFWVAEAEGQIVGTVAICMHERDVAHLTCLRAIEGSTAQDIRKSLVQVAAGHAHRHGCLKLVLHAQVADTGRAAEFLHRLGFEFSQHRKIDKRPVLEFYLNLYERPELIPFDPAMSPIASWAQPR